MKLFIHSCILFLTVSALAAEPELIRVQTTFKSASALEPWGAAAEVQKAPGFVFNSSYALTFVEKGQARTAFAQIRNGRFPMDVTRLDGELRLAVVKLVRPESNADKANPILTESLGSAGALPLVLNLAALPIKTPLRAAGDHPTHTVFYEGTGSARTPAGNAWMPTVRFSGFQKQIKPGDFLLNDGGIVGVIAGFDESTNTGYAIPAAIIEQFLSSQVFDTQRNSVALQNQAGPEPIPSRVPPTIVRSSGLGGTTASEPAYLRYMGLVTERPAFLVTRTAVQRTEERAVMQGDVILSTPGGRPSSDGKIKDDYYGDLPLPLAIVLKNGRFTDENAVSIQVLRDRVERMIRLPVRNASEDLSVVPEKLFHSSYLITGGLVLLELTGERVRAMDDATGRFRYLRSRYWAGDNMIGERIIFVDRVLPVKQNEGSRPQRAVLTSVNGIGVRNLLHAHSIIREARRKGEDVVFTFDGNEIAVFSAAALAQADEQVRNSYGIPFLYGESLE